MFYDDRELVIPFVTRITCRETPDNDPDERQSVALAFTLPSADTASNGFAVMHSMN